MEHENPDFTWANEVMEHQEAQVFAECRRIAQVGIAKETSIEAGEHAEFVVHLARVLAYNTYERMLLIVKNNGTISNLSPDAMVEIPCLVSKMGYEPLSMGPLPTFQKGMIEQQLASEKLAVEAYLEQSYEKLWQAITLNKAMPSARVAKAVLDDLIEANWDFWPELH